jgi:hypothetical protein
VLAAGAQEWAGVDLASGAFVRARVVDGRAAVTGEWAPYDVAVLEIAPDGEPPDPARPEAVDLAADPEHAGRMRRGGARRLLERLCAPEQRWQPILGTRGPSVAYVDLDGTSPSLVLVAVAAKSLHCSARDTGEVACSFSWGSTTQVLPVLDERVADLAARHGSAGLGASELAQAVGGKPRYLLVGLGPVRGGHAPKIVLSVLAKRPRRR